MAYLHKAFCKFHNRIVLTTSRKSTLRMVRDVLRERIHNYFHYTLRVEAPIFRGQGAYAMNTAVNPMDNEYNIQDGVYLQHLDKIDDDNWPTAATVHQWLLNAADGYTTEKPIDNRAYVRVRSAGLYCIDLYTYGGLNGHYLLAASGEAKWPRSDPLACTHWFMSYAHQRGEQLRRLVRYLVAWADNLSMHQGKLAHEMILTVLATQHFHGNPRDDLALAKTIEAISDAVHPEFFVLNPVNISEELTARLTTAQKKRFNDAIRAFADIANCALAIENDYKASKLWRKQFGDRFPVAPV